MLTTNKQTKKYPRLTPVPSTALGSGQLQKLSVLSLPKASQQSPLPRVVSVGLGSSGPVPSHPITLCKGAVGFPK